MGHIEEEAGRWAMAMALAPGRSWASWPSWPLAMWCMGPGGQVGHWPGGSLGQVVNGGSGFTPVRRVLLDIINLHFILLPPPRSLRHSHPYSQGPFWPKLHVAHPRNHTGLMLLQVPVTVTKSESVVSLSLISSTSTVTVTVFKLLLKILGGYKRCLKIFVVFSWNKNMFKHLSFTDHNQKPL